MRSERIFADLVSPAPSGKEQGTDLFEATLAGALDAEDAPLSQLKSGRRAPAPRGGLVAFHDPQSGSEPELPATGISKMRNFSPETAIIRYYRRGESSLEETMLELYYARISIHGAEEVSEALWGSRIRPSTVSEFSRKVTARIETSLDRSIVGRYAYVMFDLLQIKRNCDGDTKLISALLAVGVNARGYREILGVGAGAEGASSWSAFLRRLKRRGLSGVKLFVGGWQPDLISALTEVYPGIPYQCCVTQFYHQVSSLLYGSQLSIVLDLLKAVHCAANGREARVRLDQASLKVHRLKLPEAAALLGQIGPLTLSYFALPRTHWRTLRSNVSLTKTTREIRERDRVLETMADAKVAVLIVSARLRHQARTVWVRHRYLNMA